MHIELKSGKKYHINLYSKKRENFQTHNSGLPIISNDLCNVYTTSIGKYNFSTFYIYTDNLSLSYYEILEFDFTLKEGEFKIYGKVNHYNGVIDKIYNNISSEIYDILKEIILSIFKI